jgi:class 3 adenylate cyclase
MRVAATAWVASTLTPPLSLETRGPLPVANLPNRAYLHSRSTAPLGLGGAAKERIMVESAGKARSGVTFSLRLKIILTFFVISALLAGLLSVSSYTILQSSLFSSLQARVGNLTRIGSDLIDRPALKRLVRRMSARLTPEQVNEIELSADYGLVSDQLNTIRDSEKTLVRYVYLFAPTDNVNTTLYVVDADVRNLLAQRAAGKTVADEDISQFGSEFDVSPYPVARKAIADRAPQVESAYSYDDTFKVNSLSGYAPILDTDGRTVLAVVGLDMTDTDVRAVLTSVRRLTIIIAVGMLVLALVSSVLLGGLFTRGIISLDRVVRLFGENRFDERAKVKSRDEVGRLGHSFNLMAETIQRYSAQLEALLSAYGRFVPHDFLKFLEKDSVLDVKLGDQVQKEMAVLFSDIRSFTALSETMTPKETFNFLNSYLSRVGPEIRAHKGFIDKYIGDAIMALFPDTTDDAVSASIAMIRKLEEYNGHRGSSGYAPISVGIGIHTGKLMLGTLGEHERMDGSVIADAVNLSSRLQGLTRIYGGSILITGYALGQLKEPDRYFHRFIDRVRVKGRQETVQIHEIFDPDPPAIREQKAETKKDLLAAITAYYARDIHGAIAQFQALKRRSPHDRIIDIFLVRCKRLLATGMPEGWTGVEVINLK